MELRNVYKDDEDNVHFEYVEPFSDRVIEYVVDAFSLERIFEFILNYSSFVEKIEK
jgi:hypothetical protein